VDPSLGWNGDRWRHYLAVLRRQRELIRHVQPFTARMEDVSAAQSGHQGRAVFVAAHDDLQEDIGTEGSGAHNEPRYYMIS
jgi:hypothetical protein